MLLLLSYDLLTQREALCAIRSDHAPLDMLAALINEQNACTPSRIRQQDRRRSEATHINATAA